MLLGGLFLLTRRRGSAWWRSARLVVAVCAVASAVGALVVASGDLTRAYYGTDTRAYQLLAGAFLALSPDLFGLGDRWRARLRLAAPLLVLVLVVLGTSYVDVAPITRGVLVAVVISLLIVAIENSEGIVNSVLSLPAIVYLGKISYGTYLWHWPVIVVALQFVDISPVSLMALTCLLATGIASLSYQLLERPIRQSATIDRRRYPVVAVGLAVSAIAGLVLVPAVLEQESTGRAAASGEDDLAGLAPTPDDLDWQRALDDNPPYPKCYGTTVADCVAVHGPGPHLMLVGDSHARMMLPAFEDVAERTDGTLTVAIRPACWWQRGLMYADQQPEEKEDCRRRQADWYERVLTEADPDVVVVVSRPVDQPGSYGSTSVEGDGPGGDGGSVVDLVEDHVDRTARTVIDGGRRMVIVEPIPVAAKEDDPLECLSESDHLDPCRYVANAEPTPVERMYRRLADRNDALWSLDVDRLVCPYHPICDPIVDGMIVKRDAGHLTGTYATTLGDDIERLLGDSGVLDGAGKTS